MTPVGIVKIGSSNTGFLAAASLLTPMARVGYLIDLQNPENWPRLIEKLGEFRRLCVNLGVVRGLAAGGEVVRQNPLLQDMICQTGWPLWAISGTQEGQVTWFAVRSQHPQAGVVIDVGGGSTEIIQQGVVQSLPIGAAHYYHQDQWPVLNAAEEAALVGGTAFFLGKFAGRPTMTQETLNDVLERVLSTPEPKELLALDIARQNLVVGGSKVLKALIAQSHINRFIVTSRGLTEGLWIAASLGRAARL